MYDNAIKVNVSGTVRALSKAGVEVHKALPIIITRVVGLGEDFMKRDTITPWRTGTLRRGIHGYPTIRSTGIGTNVAYAFLANARSSRPGFIELTSDYVVDMLPEETRLVIQKKLNKVIK